MKESIQFINFFKKNSLYLLIPAILVGICAFSYSLTLPSKYLVSQSLEFNYQLDDVNTKVVLADQAVARLRALARLEEGDIEIYVFKPGPLLIQIDVKSSQQGLSMQTNKKYVNEVESTYQVKKVGNAYENVSDVAYPKYLLGGIILGFSLGLLIALVKNYLHNY